MIFESVITKILSKEIILEDVTKWLASPKASVEVFQGSHRIDFANFFLAFVREQACVLESKLVKTPSNTPVKCLKGPPVLDFESNSRRPQQRRICSRKLPLGAEIKNERFSPESHENAGRRNQKPHSRLGPQTITLANFIVPKTSQREKKNARANLKLDSNEEFPEIGVVKKRIQPVMVAPPRAQEIENSGPNPFTAAPEVNALDVLVERTKLKLECLKIQARETVPIKLDVENNTEQLDILSSIYTTILQNDLVLNFMSEFYFLMELLCVPIATEEEQPKIFGNSQNCTYFAAKTLSSLHKVMEHLDSTTVRLLTENSRLEEVCPELVAHLKHLLPSLQSKACVSLNTIIGFQVDNENKKNFSTPDSFQVYRRQRDGFYALLEDWDSERQFTKTLTKDAVAIFEHFPIEPENYAYFCRLFVSQLICSCIGDGPNGVGKTPLDFQVDPERLKRLHERLVTPAKALSGPCPQPEFTGWEEFFRDFIVIAANMGFNQHLQDAFVTKLHELDNQQFTPTELQPKVFVVEEETRNKYLACVVSSQLVAKFLGFVQFYSYKTITITKKLSEQSAMAQASLREQIIPVIDTHERVIKSEKSCRLILTIPWLCSYILQMDPVTLRLPVYQATISSLVSILRSLPNRPLSSSASFLVRLNIGWCLANLTEVSPNIWAIFRNAPSCRGFAKVANSVDDLDLVDSRTLSSVCPFVSELRTILSGNTGNSKTGQNIGPKHITPIAAANGDPVLQLELQLEASFVQTQATTVRQTIEFITERMTSLCTTYLQETVITSEMQRLDSDVQEKVQSEAKNLDPSLSFTETVGSLKRNLEFWSSTASDEHLMTLSKKCSEKAFTYVSDRCLSLLKQLLPSNISSVQCEAFAHIICKNVCDKIKSWLQTTYGPSEMQKKLKECVEKAAKQRARSGDHPTTPKSDPQASLRMPADRQSLGHDESVICPAELLINIREVIIKLNGRQSVSGSEIEGLLSLIEAVLSYREDLIPVAHSILRPLTVDLIISLVAFAPQEVTEDIVVKLIGLWHGSLGRPDQLDRIMCPRHMHLLFNGKTHQQSWLAFKRLLQGLLNANLLSPALVEEQAVGVLQLEWPPSFLEMYSTCINDLVRDAGASSKEGESEDASFTQLLPWLADYCSNLEDLPGE